MKDDTQKEAQCKDCVHEYLLAYSCNRLYFYYSYHQKRVIELGESLCMNILKKKPHHHFFKHTEDLFPLIFYQLSIRNR